VNPSGNQETEFRKFWQILCEVILQKVPPLTAIDKLSWRQTRQATHGACRLSRWRKALPPHVVVAHQRKQVSRDRNIIDQKKEWTSQLATMTGGGMAHQTPSRCNPWRQGMPPSLWRQAPCVACGVYCPVGRWSFFISKQRAGGLIC
jgi:hypothetical protein